VCVALCSLRERWCSFSRAVYFISSPFFFFFFSRYEKRAHKGSFSIIL
jgi:hypothetical protein